MDDVEVLQFIVLSLQQRAKPFVLVPFLGGGVFGQAVVLSELALYGNEEDKRLFEITSKAIINTFEDAQVRKISTFRSRSAFLTRAGPAWIKQRITGQHGYEDDTQGE